jgi:hypothetical protein
MQEIDRFVGQELIDQLPLVVQHSTGALTLGDVVHLPEVDVKLVFRLQSNSLHVKS